jgi:hypothetical protein
VVRASHTLKKPTSRKSAMVSRLWSNPSIQKTWNHPPVSDSGGVPSNAPDKQVTNGVVGSLSGGKSFGISRTKTPHPCVGSEEPQRLLIAENKLPGPVRRP